VDRLYKLRGAEVSVQERNSEIDARLAERVYSDSSFLDEIIADADPAHAAVKRTLLTKIKELVDKLVSAFKGEKVPASIREMRAKLTEAFKSINATMQVSESFEGSDTTSLHLGSVSSYSPEKQSIIRNYLSSVNQNLRAFIEKCRNGEDMGNRWLVIGSFDAKQSQEISDLLGADYSGYTIVANQHAFKHIERRHGINGKADSSMKILDDVARVGFVLGSYDYVKRTTHADGNDKLVGSFSDKHNNPAPLLEFGKRIDGKYYVTIACPDAKAKRLWLISAYIGNNKNSSAPQVLNAEALSVTSDILCQAQHKE